MNHPYELLADLVDGTLDEARLAGVQAHLDACAACRDDVAHATAGREAARSLPQEVPPADLHDRVVTAAGGGRRAPGWYRWAGAAAAAAVVLAIAVALPDIGGGEDGPAAEISAPGTFESAPVESQAAGRGVVYSIEDTDYDEVELRALAENADERTLAPGGAQVATDAAGADAAEECVRNAFDQRPVGRLARLIDARFRGRDAYIALFLEGPGAGEPADTASVWVAAKDDCSVLSYAFAAYDP